MKDMSACCAGVAVGWWSCLFQVLHTRVTGRTSEPAALCEIGTGDGNDLELGRAPFCRFPGMLQAVALHARPDLNVCEELQLRCVLSLRVIQSLEVTLHGQRATRSGIIASPGLKYEPMTTGTVSRTSSRAGAAHACSSDELGSTIRHMQHICVVLRCHELHQELTKHGNFRPFSR